MDGALCHGDMWTQVSQFCEFRPAREVGIECSVHFFNRLVRRAQVVDGGDSTGSSGLRREMEAEKPLVAVPTLAPVQLIVEVVAEPAYGHPPEPVIPALLGHPPKTRLKLPIRVPGLMTVIVEDQGKPHCRPRWRMSRRGGGEDELWSLPVSAERHGPISVPKRVAAPCYAVLQGRRVNRFLPCCSSRAGP